MSKAAHLKGQLAYRSRKDVACPPERLAELRRDYQAARLAEDLRSIVRKAGPFTPDQARELAGIIRGKTATQAAAAA